jgi:hypothetical protein
MNQNQVGNVLKGAAAGLVGGLIASWTMNQFQVVWSKATEALAESNGVATAEASNSQQLSTENAPVEDNATVKAARAISEGVFGRELKENEKEFAGSAVHYAFGSSTGALYGAVAELAPEVTVGAGVPFGAAFWLAADETAVPLLGLAKGPTEYPVSTHAYALASHLVYGLTTELVRRAIRRAV